MKMDKNNLNGEKERLIIPSTVALGATAGAWFAPFGLLVFLPLWLGLVLLYKIVVHFIPNWPQKLQTAPYCTALMLLMIYPQTVEIARDKIIKLVNMFL